jgi:hypothetical protein
MKVALEVLNNTILTPDKSTFAPGRKAGPGAAAALPIVAGPALAML